MAFSIQGNRHHHGPATTKAQMPAISSEQIRRIGYLTTAILALSVIYKVYNFYQLDQMSSIDCSLDQKRNFSFYKKLADEGSAAAQHCLAGMFKKGIGVDQSLPDARYWYKKASDQGLYLSKVELCRPSLYKDWSDQQIEEADRGDLVSLCCPSKSTCPWWPVFANDSSDWSSLGGGRVFGKAPGDF